MSPRGRRALAAGIAVMLAADVGLLVGIPIAISASERQAAVRSATLQAERVQADASAAATAAARAAAGHLQDPVTPQMPQRSTARPLRVIIPAIGVNAYLERLHRDSAGELLAPTVADEAGWFADGVVPGDQGPAIIAGHLDNILGPAVFVRLRDLRPGDVIEVEMSDHRTIRFVVDSARVVVKARFPTADVYGPTPDAQLRLITCNEPFDSEVHHYSDNLVVFATKVG